MLISVLTNTGSPVLTALLTEAGGPVLTPVLTDAETCTSAWLQEAGHLLGFAGSDNRSIVASEVCCL